MTIAMMKWPSALCAFAVEPDSECLVAPSMRSARTGNSLLAMSMSIPLRSSRVIMNWAHQ